MLKVLSLIKWEGKYWLLIGNYIHFIIKIPGTQFTYTQKILGKQFTSKRYIETHLRYLSTDTYFAALKFDFLVGRSTIGIIVKDMCQALWTVLQPTEMPVPTMNDWLPIRKNVVWKKT